MSEYLPLPSLEHLKQQAKRLRAQLEGDGPKISHSKTLELLAHQYGYKDWNTLHATAQNQPEPAPLRVGGRVSGLYMSQPFEGKVVQLAERTQMDGFRITVHFDKPVNVSKFESMEVNRQRVSSHIGKDGNSPQKTSDGVPIMQINMN